MLARIFNNLESIICRTLLSGFVLLLFVQIVAREVFGYSFSWIEELSVYMFVWFVFFGASYAALKGAHNRVTFQFRFLPRAYVKWVEAFADLFWLAFNVTFIWLSYDFVFNKMNAFWKSQTLGIEMKWVYVVLPVAFTLMTIRILQVNYIKLVRGEDVSDPDQIDLDSIKSDSATPRMQEA